MTIQALDGLQSEKRCGACFANLLQGRQLCSSLALHTALHSMLPERVLQGTFSCYNCYNQMLVRRWPCY